MMPSADEIDRQIEQIPQRYVFWTRKEIRSLPSILEDGERILALTSGYMQSYTWLAVCTQRRLILLNRGMILGLRQVQLPLDRIQAIDHEYKLFFGSIRIWDGATYYTLGMIAKYSIDPFVRTTQEAIHQYRQHNSATKSIIPDIASQLAKLAELREKGFLSAEEFENQKKKLLS